MKYAKYSYVVTLLVGFGLLVFGQKTHSILMHSIASVLMFSSIITAILAFNLHKKIPKVILIVLVVVGMEGIGAQHVTLFYAAFSVPLIAILAFLSQLSPKTT